MLTPDPPYLKTIRMLLLSVGFVGIAVIFHSFCWSQSPFSLMLNAVSDIAKGGFWHHWRAQSEHFVLLAFAGPYFIAGASVVAQFRSDGRTAWRIWERRFLLAAVVLSGMATFIVASVFLSGAMGFDGGEHDPQTRRTLGIGMLIECAGLLGALLLIVGLRRRRLHELPVLLILLRLFYFSHIMAMAVALEPWKSFWSSDGLIGRCLSIAVGLAYAVEAAILFRYGEPHASGTVSSQLLRYWLPTPDTDPREGISFCDECGYDLRGSVGTRGRICPECGTVDMAA